MTGPKLYVYVACVVHSYLYECTSFNEWCVDGKALSALLTSLLLKVFFP